MLSIVNNIGVTLYWAGLGWAGLGWAGLVIRKFGEDKSKTLPVEVQNFPIVVTTVCLSKPPH